MGEAAPKESSKESSKESTMEDILASIRKIITADNATSENGSEKKPQAASQRIASQRTYEPSSSADQSGSVSPATSVGSADRSPEKPIEPEKPIQVEQAAKPFAESLRSTPGLNEQLSPRSPINNTQSSNNAQSGSSEGSLAALSSSMRGNSQNAPAAPSASAASPNSLASLAASVRGDNREVETKQAAPLAESKPSPIPPAMPKTDGRKSGNTSLPGQEQSLGKLAAIASKIRQGEVNAAPPTVNATTLAEPSVKPETSKSLEKVEQKPAGSSEPLSTVPDTDSARAAALELEASEIVKTAKAETQQPKSPESTSPEPKSPELTSPVSKSSKSTSAEKEFKEALVSPSTQSAVSSSFEKLKKSVEDNQAAHVEAALRPMLKQWLDDNLPAMVEKMVQAEIKRIVEK